VEAAARVANAHGFITELPEGYDTVVGAQVWVEELDSGWSPVAEGFESC
jgi:ABC-type protease/lipase transport system fused ATPase/permease subunit